MSTAALLAPHLPSLRRYARALSGDQATGDAAVAATLSALRADPPRPGRPADAKVALFRAFSRLWNGGPEPPPAALTGPGEDRLRRMTPLPRQAFLLVGLDGFGEDETGRILDLDRAAVRRLIEAAGRELADDLATDVLIIEDEPLIALNIEALVDSLGHRVVGIARTRAEAAALAREAGPPGLILADIQLADGSSGLEAVDDVLAGGEVPVVFITAYPERFLTGARPEPAFLIAKPFRQAHAAAVISQALFFRRNARRRARPAPLGPC